MGRAKTNSGRCILVLAVVAFVITLPTWALGDDYPTSRITMYCGYAPGGTTDTTARALADGISKILGVPVVVETKAGAGATVCAGLTASKKPDGYTIAVISTGALVSRPHLLKIAYDPMNDFTLFCKYTRYIGALTVLAESPIKTVDDFIAWAKANPGLSYSSSGMYTQQQMAVELFAECKGLTLTHVPCKGGGPANRQLLGKHVDFTAGAGSHLNFVKQGLFRQLVFFNTDKRNPDYPDLPTLKELGCKDAPALSYIVVGPKGIPGPIVKKLTAALKQVKEGPEFQKLLKNLGLPADVWSDGEAFKKEVQEQYEWYKGYLERIGAQKKG